MCTVYIYYVNKITFFQKVQNKQNSHSSILTNPYNIYNISQKILTLPWYTFRILFYIIFPFKWLTLTGHKQSTHLSLCFFSVLNSNIKMHITMHNIAKKTTTKKNLNNNNNKDVALHLQSLFAHIKITFCTCLALSLRCSPFNVQWVCVD